MQDLNVITTIDNENKITYDTFVDGTGDYGLLGTNEDTPLSEILCTQYDIAKALEIYKNRILKLETTEERIQFIQDLFTDDDRILELTVTPNEAGDEYLVTFTSTRSDTDQLGTVMMATNEG